MKKLLKAQKKAKKSAGKSSSSSSSSSKASKDKLDDTLVKTLNKIFKMKLKADTKDNVVEQILAGAELQTPNVKRIAKTYSMHSNYQSAGKDTNRKSFIAALIRKLE